MANSVPHTKKVKALYDIWTFADIINFHGGHSAFGDIHDEVADFLTSAQQEQHKLLEQTPNMSPMVLGEKLTEKYMRRLLMLPRGHLKSTMLVLYVMWRIYRNPNIRILLGTNLKRLAKSFIRELRQYFEDKTLQDTIWNKRPHIDGILVPALDAAGKRRRQSSRDYDESEAEDKKIIWNNETIQVVRPKVLKEPTIAVISTGTTVTGDHYDLVILDDIVDFKNSDTAGKRERIADWAADLDSVLDPLHIDKFERLKTVHYDAVGNEVVVTGTRYFGGDYYDYILENYEEIEYGIMIRNIFKNGVDNSDGYLYHEKFNERILELIKKRTPTVRRFAAQYLNQIMSEEEMLFHWDVIQWIDPDEIKTRGQRILYKSKQIRLFCAVDPRGNSTKEASDYAAIVVGGYDDELNFYVFDIRYGRWRTSEFLSVFWETMNKWHMSLVHIDTNGVGAHLEHAIKQSFQEAKRVVSVRPFSRKGSLTKKEDWIEDTLEPLFDNEKIYALRHLQKNKELKDELSYFPRAAHDDVIDAMSMVAFVAQRTRNVKKSKTYKNVKEYNTRYGGVR